MRRLQASNVTSQAHVTTCLRNILVILPIFSPFNTFPIFCLCFIQKRSILCFGTKKKEYLLNIFPSVLSLFTSIDQLRMFSKFPTKEINKPRENGKSFTKTFKVKILRWEVKVILSQTVKKCALVILFGQILIPYFFFISFPFLYNSKVS